MRILGTRIGGLSHQVGAPDVQNGVRGHILSEGVINMKITGLLAAGALALGVSVAAAGSAQAAFFDVGFDDLGSSSGGAAVPNGYAGFNWNNVDYLTPSLYFLNPSGYQNGVVSPGNVAFNAYAALGGFSANSPFTLYGIFMTAAWNNGLSVTIDGYSDAGGSNLIDTKTVTLDATGPTLVSFNWSGLEDVTFVGTGGTSAGFPGAGTHVAIDEIEGNRVSPVPLPAALPLFGVALAGVGFFGRRFRKTA